VRIDNTVVDVSEATTDAAARDREEPKGLSPADVNA
jgi:hypothetical protein